MIEKINFFVYIRRYCPSFSKIYLKNNRIVNFSQEEINFNKFTEISLDNDNHRNILISNDDDKISRINKFNIENSKKYYSDGILVSYPFQNLYTERRSFSPQNTYVDCV